jgi:hypothetical protein
MMSKSTIEEERGLGQHNLETSRWREVIRKTVTSCSSFNARANLFDAEKVSKLLAGEKFLFCALLDCCPKMSLCGQ